MTVTLDNLAAVPVEKLAEAMVRQCNCLVLNPPAKSILSPTAAALKGALATAIAVFDSEPNQESTSHWRGIK